MQTDPFLLLKTEIARFCRLNEDTWNCIRPLFSMVEISKNEFFSKEGECPSSFGFVLQGCFRSFNLAESGKELTKHFYRPNDFVAGAINFYDLNIESISAVTNCKALVADYKSIEEKARDNMIVADLKNRLVSHYVRIKQRRENNYLSMDSINRYILFAQEFPNLINEIPHHYIASYLGISTTHLSRIRKKYSEQIY